MRLLLAALAAVYACAAEAHIMGHPEFDSWLMAQQRPNDIGGRCCDKSDAYLLDDEDVRIRDGQYQARLNGTWVEFPNTGKGKPGNTVFGFMANPTGGYVAWATRTGDGTYYPLCFAEGTGT